MKPALLVLLLVVPTPTAAHAQIALDDPAEGAPAEVGEASSPAEVGEEAPPPADPIDRLVVAEAPRTFADRYVDALGGAWAGAALGAAIGASVTVGLGLAIGCTTDSSGLGCVIGLVLGAITGGPAGWLVGTGIGTSLGAGVPGHVGLAALGLGLLAAGVLTTLPTLVGASADDIGWGVAIGAPLGGLGVVFLTPLFAVALAGPEDTEDPLAARWQPLVAPRRGGLTVGAVGSF